MAHGPTRSRFPSPGSLAPQPCPKAAKFCCGTASPHGHWSRIGTDSPVLCALCLLFLQWQHGNYSHRSRPHSPPFGLIATTKALAAYPIRVVDPYSLFLLVFCRVFGRPLAFPRLASPFCADGCRRPECMARWVVPMAVLSQIGRDHRLDRSFPRCPISSHSCDRKLGVSTVR